MKSILTIAGHDLSGGAGITKDAEIFSALQCHPLTVPTAFVIQGPKGVREVFPVPPDQLRHMLRTVTEEVQLHGIKIGVASDLDQVEVVADFLRSNDGIPVVLDPVLSAKNGYPLLSEEGRKALIDKILPFLDLIMPNVEEAAVLTGSTIADREEMKRAAHSLKEMGASGALIKGGHVPGNPADLLLDRENRVVWWEKRRIDRIIHGTGCTLSSLVLAFLVHGFPLVEAFRGAEQTIDEMLKNSYQIGQGGYFYTSLTLLKSESAERWNTVSMLKQAMERFTFLNMVDLIPEVQMNLGYAIPNPKGTEDVAAFVGGIGHFQGRVVFKDEPCFDASPHVARLILAYMTRFPFMRACANVRCSTEILCLAEKHGMSIALADCSSREPERSKEKGRSLDFLVTETLKGATTAPDIIYDLGDKGGRPILCIFARDPQELIHKMEIIRPWRIN